MDNEELIKLRRQISDTDEALLDILSKRQAMTAKVAALKIKHNKPVRDKAREKQLLAKLIEQAKDRGLGAEIVTRLFHIIIENSVLQQQSLLEQDANPSALKENARLAILGEKGSYSYFAGKKYFARRSRECVEIGCK
ncbi:MAG: chorismate mutase, partial [Pseudomonadota bacterium]